MLNPLYIFTVATNNPFAATVVMNILKPLNKPKLDNTTAFSSEETSLVNFDRTEGVINTVGIIKIVEKYTMKVVLEKLKTAKLIIVVKVPINIRV